jgi:hypothetical protein
MDIDVLVLFAACAVVFALVMHVSWSTVRTVGGMYHAPDLGWPSGVQEDDDLQWSWSAEPVRVDDDRRRLAGPVLEEAGAGARGLPLQPVHRGVR